jgi:hypothetical protein
MIRQAHDDLGHSRGWRFLTVPRRTLEALPEIALITLNPGGSGPDPSQGEGSCEYGSAHRMESWGAPAGQSALQVQVLALLEQLRLRLQPDTPTVEFVDHRVLGAYYVPFRSPSFSTLVSSRKSLDFAKALWTHVLTAWTPRLLVTIDHHGFAGIRSILTEALLMSVTDSRVLPTGWGNCRAELIRCTSPRRAPITLIRLPHLSTYKVFSRQSCLPHVGKILDYATAG